MTKEQVDSIYWERLLMVMKFAEITNANAFAFSIGLQRPEILYQIKNGKSRISRKLAELINRSYPMFSVIWLIYGDTTPDKNFDEMAEVNGMVKIPFYEDLLHTEITDSEPAKFMYLPKYISQGAQFATIYYDNLLSESISCGAHLLLKKHVGEIIYGNIYMMKIKEERLFRIVRSVPDNKNQLRLTTSRPSVYDDIIVNKKSVTPLYVVCGAITNFCL